MCVDTGLKVSSFKIILQHILLPCIDRIITLSIVKYKLNSRDGKKILKKNSNYFI